MRITPGAAEAESSAPVDDHTTPAEATDRAVLWPLHVGAFLATYMFSVSNIAIPAVKEALGAGDSASALVVGLFSAAFASGLILCGRIGDRFGRRRLFTLGTAALVVISLAVGLAPGTAELLIARTVQGFAAAVMMPQILASIQHALFGAERLKAISLFGAFSGVGTVSGQVIGGGLISAFGPTWGWRAAFLSCAVVALAAFLGSLRLTESRTPSPAPLDLGGAVLLGIGMVGLVIGLALGPVTSWVPLPAALLVVSAAALAAFAVWQSVAEARGRDPLIPPQVVRAPAAWVGMLMSFVFFGGFGTFLFNFALTSQTGYGDPAFVSGMTLGLFAAAFLAVSLLVPRIVRRLSGPGTMLLGTGLQILGLLGVAEVADAAGREFNLWFQLPALILGAGQALQFGPLVGTVVSAVPDRVAGLSGGLIATMQQAGIAVGVALLGALFHVFTAWFGYDDAFALASLTQIVLSLVFGAGALVLLRVQRAATPA
ncbi:MFS transporter [Brevibacterium casei]|uniref:MFS transporter n=1 Tax=Brevibacterium casei TaxID=33889 RepID=UPI00223B1CE8|nr:MFS transporter [Brevibacterium casei]MCT1765129.1 MFS transporter [Brevibacterium casei]